MLSKDSVSRLDGLRGSGSGSGSSNFPALAFIIKYAHSFIISP